MTPFKNCNLSPQRSPPSFATSHPLLPVPLTLPPSRSLHVRGGLNLNGRDLVLLGAAFLLARRRREHKELRAKELKAKESRAKESKAKEKKKKESLAKEKKAKELRSKEASKKEQFNKETITKN